MQHLSSSVRLLSLFIPKSVRSTSSPQILLRLQGAYTITANTARDLEVFSKHAGRNTINTDDVLLLGRRNEQLQGLLEKELEDIRAAEGRKADGQPVARAQPAAAGKKRGRPAGTGKGKAKA